jgi:hypothetical protein
MRRLRDVFTAQFLAGVVVTLVFGIIASVIANVITKEVPPRLVVDVINSNDAGLSVTDIKIRNGGPVDLGDIKLHIKLSAGVALSAVEPDSFSRCSRLEEGVDFTLDCSGGPVLKPSARISLRFSGKSYSPLVRIDQVLSELSAAEIHSPVYGEERQDSFFSSHFAQDPLLDTILGVVLILAVLFLFKGRQPAKAGSL